MTPQAEEKISKMTDYTIIIEKSDGNCSAYCPDLPGVAVAAESEEETLVHHNTSFKEQYRTVDAVLLMHRS